MSTPPEPPLTRQDIAGIQAALNELADKVGATSTPTPPSSALLALLQQALADLGVKRPPETLTSIATQLQSLISSPGTDATATSDPAANLHTRLRQLLKQLSGLTDTDKATTLSALIGKLEVSVGGSAEAPVAGKDDSTVLGAIDKLTQSMTTWREELKPLLSAIQEKLETRENLSPDAPSSARPGAQTQPGMGTWLLVLGLLNFLCLVTCFSLWWRLGNLAIEQPKPAARPDGGALTLDAGSPAVTAAQPEHPVFQQCSPMLMCPETKCICPPPTVGPIVIHSLAAEPGRPAPSAALPDGGSAAPSSSKPPQKSQPVQCPGD